MDTLTRSVRVSLTPCCWGCGTAFLVSLSSDPVINYTIKLWSSAITSSNTQVSLISSGKIPLHICNKLSHVPFPILAWMLAHCKYLGEELQSFESVRYWSVLVLDQRPEQVQRMLVWVHSPPPSSSYPQMPSPHTEICGTQLNTCKIFRHNASNLHCMYVLMAASRHVCMNSIYVHEVKLQPRHLYM